MNPRLLVIGAIVLVVLVLGGVAAFFFVAKKQQPKAMTEAEKAEFSDADSDGYTDGEENRAGTSKDDPNRYPGSHKKILRAREFVAANTLIKEDQLREEEIAVKGGAPATVVEASDKTRVVGKVAKQDIRANDMIIEGMVFASEKLQLSFLVPKYKRAISIEYDELAAVSGLTELGDLIDVIGFFNIRRQVGGEMEYSKTMVQNARIIAKGALFAPRDPKDTSPVPPVTGLTVAVYPHEAEELVWMQKYAGGGDLTLALRAPVNDVFARTAGVTENTMFSRELLNDPKEIEMYRGAVSGHIARFEPTGERRMDLSIQATDLTGATR